MLTQSRIMELLRDYLHSAEGQKYQKRNHIEIKDKGGSKQSNREIQDVLEQIKYKFIAAVQSRIPSLSANFVHANIIRREPGKGAYATITVDNNGLHRNSLFNVDKSSGETSFTGEGVRDILSLFTHGYTIRSARPYGYWVQPSGEWWRVGALMDRAADPFLQNLVDDLNAKYKGRCVVTLNQDYQL